MMPGLTHKRVCLRGAGTAYVWRVLMHTCSTWPSAPFSTPPVWSPCLHVQSGLRTIFLEEARTPCSPQSHAQSCSQCEGMEERGTARAECLGCSPRLSPFSHKFWPSSPSPRPDSGLPTEINSVFSTVLGCFCLEVVLHLPGSEGRKERYRDFVSGLVFCGFSIFECETGFCFRNSRRS